MLSGAEVLLKSPHWMRHLKGKRLAYLAHSASVDQKGGLILSLLLKHRDLQMSCLFSPQHGFFPLKQANMIPTEDSLFKDLKLFSLYSSKTRRLTQEMLESFDVLLFDLQDTGCRVYTYLSSLFYMMEDCEKAGKGLVVLDRPNPLGRYVEGSLLKKEFISFVGTAPRIPISHGMSFGELALWRKASQQMKLDLSVIPMERHSLEEGLGWPKNQPWIWTSPNITGLSCVSCYPGVVLLEACHISEGRGTTKPFELFGCPGMKSEKIKELMESEGSEFLKGCFLRETEFEPVFDKFKGKPCRGFQIHIERQWARSGLFRPYRLMSLFLKTFRQIHPSQPFLLAPPYEYEYEKDPIDIISGGLELKNYLQQASFSAKAWDEFLKTEEAEWKKEQRDFLLY